MIVSRIKSAPAEALLILTALVTLVYSLNFMFAADCYVTGGEGCFTLLSNKSHPLMALGAKVVQNLLSMVY